jgi:L-lysine exporter family protein LysE/ArgO
MGFSLIIAIGAQNAFVIRQGLSKSHLPLVVVTCASADVLLILIGTGGLGTPIQANTALLEIIRWFGVLYLLWFGYKSLRSVFRAQTLSASTNTHSSRTKALLATLAITFLNPHVYLDTVIFVGSIANQFGADRWYFAAGASTASIIWFATIGFGAQAASKYLAKPIFWKILDSCIAIVMFTLASTLAFYSF